MLRDIINNEDPFLARITAVCNRGITTGETAVHSQLLHLLLDHRAIDASRRDALCIRTVGIGSQGRKKDGDGSTSNLSAGAVDVGIGHGVFDPVLKVDIYPIGSEIVLRAPEATLAGCCCDIRTVGIDLKER